MPFFVPFAPYKAKRKPMVSLNYPSVLLYCRIKNKEEQAMTTQLYTTITSTSVSKESDVDAPVRFPKGEAEVARKADKVGCVACMRENKCLVTGLITACVDLPIGTSATIVAGAIGGFSGEGLTGIGIGLALVGTAALGVSLGALACTFADPEARAICCGCCKSKVKEKPELEEIVAKLSEAKEPVDESSV